MTHPLPNGTHVAFDLCHGDATGQGAILGRKFLDDAWLYRLDVTEGTNVDKHRNEDGFLWAWDFEVQVLDPTPGG